MEPPNRERSGVCQSARAPGAAASLDVRDTCASSRARSPGVRNRLCRPSLWEAGSLASKAVNRALGLRKWGDQHAELRRSHTRMFFTVSIPHPNVCRARQPAGAPRATSCLPLRAPGLLPAVWRRPRTEAAPAATRVAPGGTGDDRPKAAPAGGGCRQLGLHVHARATLHTPVPRLPRSHANIERRQTRDDAT